MKTFIENRDGKKVCVVVEEAETPGKLAIVMHGLGGDKGQGHIRAMAEAFLETGYTVVTFDTTNSFGESDGNYEDATITNYYADLEDVISWASGQSWYVEPFVLCGHSLGGISVALFAEKYPAKVKALAPISTVVSGKISLDAHKLSTKLENLEEWKSEGVRVTKSHDGTKVKRLKWSHMEDRLKYDLLPGVNKLTMPVLMIVGEKDDPTPLVHQQILYEKLPGKKELHIIKGALHSFYEPHEQQELKRLVKNWTEKI
ncbi:MAG: alpha/beta hydrolase [Candidatus Saccharimonadales bacterium]